MTADLHKVVQLLNLSQTATAFQSSAGAQRSERRNIFNPLMKQNDLLFSACLLSVSVDSANLTVGSGPHVSVHRHLSAAGFFSLFVFNLRCTVRLQKRPGVLTLTLQ